MNKFTEEMLEKLVRLKAEGKTWNQMVSEFKGFSANALRKTFYRNAEKPAKIDKESLAKKAKVLILDIETSPLEVYSWGLFDQNIGLEMVKKDWSILSVSAKWLGSPENEVMYFDNRNEKDPRDDRKLLKLIHSLLEEASVTLTQNGVKFDIKKLQARFVLNGMKPPSSFRNIDTLKIAKKHFGFTSNKLAYMSDKLCTKYKKLDHSDFPGFSLWKECLAGNLKAWKSMEEYNRFDVLSLEELYYKLAPWDKTLNFQVYNDELDERCSCGSNHFKDNGHIHTNSGKFKRETCTICGKEYKVGPNLLTKEKRKSLKK